MNSYIQSSQTSPRSLQPFPDDSQPEAVSTSELQKLVLKFNNVNINLKIKK